MDATEGGAKDNQEQGGALEPLFIIVVLWNIERRDMCGVTNGQGSRIPRYVTDRGKEDQGKYDDRRKEKQRDGQREQ